jgi:hypothetical protein
VVVERAVAERDRRPVLALSPGVAVLEEARPLDRRALRRVEHDHGRPLDPLAGRKAPPGDDTAPLPLDRGHLQYVHPSAPMATAFAAIATV